MAGKKLPKGITKHANGHYQGSFQLNGKRYFVYGVTIKEAAEKLDNLKYEVTHGLYCEPNNMTVESWFAEWKKTYKEDSVKKSTIDRYTRSFELYIEPKLGKYKIEDVQPQMIQRLINDMHKEGYSESQIKIVYAILKGMFTQALRNQMILRNPTDAITLPRFKRMSQDDRRVMTLEEQKKFLEFAKDSVYYPFYVIALETGMRINEVCGLQWKDIDFKRKEIHVSGTLVYIRKKGRIKDTPKSQSSDRKIPMLPDVEKVLRDCRKQQLENRVLLGENYKVEQELPDIALTYPEGGAFWDEGIRKDIQKIVDQINASGITFEAITPHTFRHSFATRCAEQGMPLQVLKTILGHSSLAMTSDLYSHVLPDTKQEEMKKIANLF